MILVHKIRLFPNDEQATRFAKSCGVARFAYNWALAEWKRQYEAGEKPSEVSKIAPQQALKNLGRAFQNTFSRLSA